jgi:hypothetical protein
MVAQHSRQEPRQVPFEGRTGESESITGALCPTQRCSVQRPTHISRRTTLKTQRAACNNSAQGATHNIQHTSHTCNTPRTTYTHSAQHTDRSVLDGLSTGRCGFGFATGVASSCQARGVCCGRPQLGRMLPELLLSVAKHNTSMFSVLPNGPANAAPVERRMLPCLSSTWGTRGRSRSPVRITSLDGVHQISTQCILTGCG